MGLYWVKRRLLLAEVVAYLLGARFALAVFSFNQLTRFFERPARQPELTVESRINHRQVVRSAIYQIHRRFPGRSTCFHRAIAAQAMLRRRGISTSIYYGAATLPGQGLVTHAWVQDGAEGVVGYLAAQKGHYHILGRYPEST